jgi:hypothetical protein
LGGVHHHALAHQQSALAQVRVGCEQGRCAQLVLLQQTAEVQQHRGARCVLAAQVDTLYSRIAWLS